MSNTVKNRKKGGGLAAPERASILIVHKHRITYMTGIDLLFKGVAFSLSFPGQNCFTKLILIFAAF